MVRCLRGGSVPAGPHAARYERDVSDTPSARAGTAMSAVMTATRARATVREVPCATKPITGGAIIQPPYPTVATAATDVPGSWPGVRPAALNVSGTTVAMP